MDFTILTDLLWPITLMAAGIVLLVKGGAWTIDSSVFVARQFGISPLIVGFTIIAFGTSLPELLISVLANLEGSPGIALGNVIGSNIANVCLVIGLTAALVPLATQSPGIRRDVIMMLFTTGILAIIMTMGEIGRIVGGMLVAILIAYVLYQYWSAKHGKVPADALVQEAQDVAEFSKPVFAYLFLLLGLVMIAGGAEVLVNGARQSAAILGVPEAVIALSVIALGTSLPELSTCLIAGRKGHSDIALGNILGSNVFNILMILGVTALVKPIAAGSFAPQLVSFDIYVMGISSLIFALLILGLKGIPRIAGIGFCLAYITYNIYIYAIYL